MTRYPSLSACCLGMAAGLLGLLLAGCEGGGSGTSLLNPGGQRQERWTIRCWQAEGPEHAQQAEQLAAVLRQVRSLDARQVRIATSASRSTLYYGQYTKVPSADGSRLVFPEDYQRDIALIQRVALNDRIPLFSMAAPEVMDAGPQVVGADWDVRRAPGPYTLQIGVFYNTPTFEQRKEAAEEYVKLLRDEGIEAYFYHEPARSFVFVGNFAESDIEKGADGPRFGPRVQELIARRPEEFPYMLENLHRVKHSSGDGRMMVPPSLLVPVPRDPLP